ncbi:MAG: FAD-dependent oxidoreductase [Vicinamibacterales bacterium]
MKFIDLNQLPDASTVTADVCIIGAGAAGITVASELDGTAQSVCLLEAGGTGPDDATQALYDLDVVGQPVREHFMSRARYYGGTCNLWAGRSMALTPIDFEPRDWIPHSGWPLPYDELARYYPRAAAILRLPSFDRLPALEHAPTLTPFERGVFAHGDLRPSVAVWGKAPLRFSTAYRPRLTRSRNVSVYLNANVTDIRLNAAGSRVEACRAQSLGGRTVDVSARRFVVACGGLETARLLLASRATQPHGIGNAFGAVGRYYMDHPRAVFGTVRLAAPQKLSLMLGLPLSNGMAQLGVRLSDALQRQERLLNSYLSLERYWSDQTAQMYQSMVHSAKIVLRKGHAGRRFALSGVRLAKVPELIYLLAPRELLPHPIYRAARLARQRFGRGVEELTVVTFNEQMPNPESRVYLGDARDRFGMPRLVLDWRIRREETDTLLRLHAVFDGYLRQHGLGRLDHPPEGFTDRVYTDASHHLGTARMSVDPRQGVVTPDGAVHGVPNLFVAGSAVFPTAGHANPTWTIVALAVRLADHLKRTAA